MGQYGFDFAPARRVYSVFELNAQIQSLLGAEFDDIWVSGEISGAKVLGSGHCYFTLKERDSQIRCALFKGTMRFLKFKPKDGVAVLARGRVDVFAPRGEYQLVVEHLEPQGHGALQLAFDELKEKLRAEGLFETARKRQLPQFPARIGIVTSLRGAVIADLLQVLERRFPGLHIRIFPALVQGDGSVEEVVRAIQYFSKSEWAEVVILARGGGSLEDLWTFNEERVARAIAACAVPLVSAIGHETDFTIADFISDLRAPTPSAAAEMVICTRQDLLGRIEALDRRLTQILRYRLATLHRRAEQQGAERSLGTMHRAINRRFQLLDYQDSRAREAVRRALAALQLRRARLDQQLRFLDARPRLQRDRNRLQVAGASALRLMQARLAARRSQWENSLARLEQLSPLKVLERGYAIVKTKSGEVLKDPAAVEPGSALEIRLARGRLDAESK